MADGEPRREPGADGTSGGSQRLVQLIKSRTGVSFSECYQCQKCSAGCTVADSTDLLPHALIRLAQLGLEQEILESHHIWLCVSCQTCTTRCPNQIDLGSAIDALRQIAVEAGVAPAEREVLAFHEVTLDTLRRHGRMHELGMIARLKLRTGDYMKDVGMGIGLVSKGKIRIFASKVRDRKQLATMFERGRSTRGGASG